MCHSYCPNTYKHPPLLAHGVMLSPISTVVTEVMEAHKIMFHCFKSTANKKGTRNRPRAPRFVGENIE